MNYIYAIWQGIPAIQAEKVEEGNCLANINSVTDNKVDVNQIRYDAESGSLYVGRINKKLNIELTLWALSRLRRCLFQ